MSTHGSPYGAPDHSQGPPRKKMRKGTKSCIECRRRKIKCTFEPGRTAICNECYARGSTCIDQEHGDVATFAPSSSGNESSSLKDRVSNLEDLLKQVLQRLPEKGESQMAESEASQVDTQAAEVLKSLRSPSRAARASIDESLYFASNTRDSVPALSLFDNAVISTKEVPATISREQYNKAKTVISALLQLLPPIADLEIILESSQEWWAIWKSMFPNLTDRRCVTIKESVSHTLRSEKPAEVAKIMLCIALSIHQLPTDFDWNRVSIKEGPTEIMERYIATVDRLICTDEEIAATIDGIECMVLMSKWQFNMGRPRKSWLLYRRAISFAQLLGLHQVALRKPPANDMTHYGRQLKTWCHLIMGDRYLSLILGLPYAVNEQFCAPAFETAKSQTPRGSGEHYLCEFAPLITKIIDRNQNSASIQYNFTMAVEEEMEELRAKQDPSWWTHERIPGTSVEEHFERLQAQFAHHHGRFLLHMPFMLKSSADKRYQYSHTATLESAREMIKYYDALRGSENVGPHACKVIDFQAFTAAMLLLLNLCGYSQQTRGAVPQQPDLDQDQQDSALIDRTIHLLRGAAAEPGGTVAANSAQALELLAEVRDGSDDVKEYNEPFQVSIPYFGTISITTGSQFVPIKKGTYPEAGSRHLNRRFAPQTGLPTPPSMASNSTLPSPSPRESCTSTDPSRPSPYWTSSASVDQSWKANPEDPFVMFDSYMAIPTQQIDFGAMGTSATSSSNNTTSSDYLMQPPYLGTLEAQNMAAGYPFPAVSGNVDLDGGWNWFGVGAPTMQ